MDNFLLNIIDQIIASVNPVSIVLFGSRAGNNFDENSDYDICVLVNDKIGLREITHKLYKLFSKIDRPIDFIVVNATNFNQKKSINSMIYKNISQGIFLYDTK